MSVSTLIDDARSYVNEVVAPADTALQEAVNLVNQVGYTQLSYTPVSLPSQPVLPADLTAPTLTDITLELPEEPSDTLVFQDISAIEAGTAPTLTATAPTITMPSKPSAFAEFQDAAPAINTSLVFPEPPAQLLAPPLDAPTIADRAEPVAPTIQLPAFTATAPTDLPDTPTDVQARFEASYASASPQMISALEGYVDAYITKVNPRFNEAMSAIEAQLATYLSGGTGLAPAVETAIYERSRSKSDAEARRTRDAAWNTAAQRGFTLPPGALTAGLSAARQAAADLNAAAGREIVVMAAEMEQKNLQFAVTTSAELRKTILSSALSYHQNLVSINGQALSYAKSVMDSIISLYNISVQAFTARLEQYKAEAFVYEVKIKGALAAVQLYEAEINALQAMVQMDHAKVEIYRARIEALNSLAGVYRAQIEAVQGRASLEKLKLDLFSTRVQAFIGTVQAKESEWRGYTAAINGETAKVELYNTQVRGYLGQVEGYKATIDAKSEVIRAQALTNSSRAENYKATLAGYTATVTARGEVARTQIENQRQVLLSFQAQSQAQVANAQVRNEYYRTTGDIAIKNAQLSIETIVKSADLARNFATSIANLHSANATIHGQLAASAMAGMNTLVAETSAV